MAVWKSGLASIKRVHTADIPQAAAQSASYSIRISSGSRTRSPQNGELRAGAAKRRKRSFAATTQPYPPWRAVALLGGLQERRCVLRDAALRAAPQDEALIDGLNQLLDVLQGFPHITRYKIAQLRIVAFTRIFKRFKKSTSGRIKVE